MIGVCAAVLHQSLGFVKTHLALIEFGRQHGGTSVLGLPAAGGSKKLVMRLVCRLLSHFTSL
jgi:hypothetical protein